MADGEPRAGELTTVNYGWTKPTVGASDDAWGGYINTDLDGIDTTVKSVSNVANAAYPASNPAGYITAAAIPAPYVLPTASTSVLGGVKVDGTTIKAAADGTISTTVVPLGDNRLINGDMRINQRGVTSGTAVNAHPVDMWAYSATQASKGTWLQNTASAAPGFPNHLGFNSSSAYTPIATDQFAFYQAIEADMISDFAWGTANAQPVTLSFWAASSLTGTFSGSFKQYGVSRSYPFTFSIPVANAWTKIAVTIPGDTGGSWVLGGNAGSLVLQFDLGSGANFRGPANAWAAAAYNGATGAVSVVSTNAANFLVTGVKLEVGTVATPYNRQSLTKSMADCQRYYQVGQIIYSAYAGAASVAAYFSTNLPVSMRVAPTMVVTPVLQTNASGLTSGAYNPTSISFTSTITAAGAAQIGGTYTASAEL